MHCEWKHMHLLCAVCGNQQSSEDKGHFPKKLPLSFLAQHIQAKFFTKVKIILRTSSCLFYRYFLCLYGHTNTCMHVQRFLLGKF